MLLACSLVDCSDIMHTLSLNLIGSHPSPFYDYALIISGKRTERELDGCWLQRVEMDLALREVPMVHHFFERVFSQREAGGRPHTSSYGQQDSSRPSSRCNCGCFLIILSVLK